MANEGLTKKQAQKRIEALLAEAATKVSEAEAVADMYALEFDYEPDNVGTYYGTGTTGYYSDEPIENGEWYPSSWSSSSIRC